MFKYVFIYIITVDNPRGAGQPEALVEKNSDSCFIPKSRVQLECKSTADKEKTRLEELALIDVSSGERCMGHIFGYSKKIKDDKRPKEQKYCPGCKHDSYNRLCPYYKPFRLLYIEPNS